MREVTRACTRIDMEFGVRNGRRRLMLGKLKYIDRAILFTCFSKDKDIEDDTQSFNLSRWGDYRVINIKRKTIGF